MTPPMAYGVNPFLMLLNTWQWPVNTLRFDRHHVLTCRLKLRLFRLHRWRGTTVDSFLETCIDSNRAAGRWRRESHGMCDLPLEWSYRNQNWRRTARNLDQTTSNRIRLFLCAEHAPYLAQQTIIIEQTRVRKSSTHSRKHRRSAFDRSVNIDRMCPMVVSVH